MNVHIPPQWTWQQKRQLIDTISKHSLPEGVAISFIIGDLNFGDNRTDGVADEMAYTNDYGQDRVRAYFESKFDLYTELHQGDATHQTQHSLSRLDHIYAGARLLCIVEMSPIIRTIWNGTSRFRAAADHFPLNASLNYSSPPSRMRFLESPNGFPLTLLFRTGVLIHGLV